MSCSNKEDTSTISQNLCGSLSKPRIFIGDDSILKTQHGNSLQTISIFYHRIVKSIHGTMPNFNFFWLIFHFCYFRKWKSPFLRGSKQGFRILPCLFFLHKASTCGEDRKRDFCNHFCRIICVLLIQIWITSIKRK